MAVMGILAIAGTAIVITIATAIPMDATIASTVIGTTIVVNQTRRRILAYGRE